MGGKWNWKRKTERDGGESGRDGGSKRRWYAKEGKESLLEIVSVKEVQMPKFDNRENENPKKFLQEFEEFLNIRGIPDKWAKVWFRKAIGENIRDWFEAVGERAELGPCSYRGSRIMSGKPRLSGGFILLGLTGMARLQKSNIC